MENLENKLGAMFNIEYEIGESIFIDGDKIKVVPDDIESELCNGCIFADVFCDGIICLGNIRKDEQDVKFVLA